MNKRIAKKIFRKRYKNKLDYKYNTLKKSDTIIDRLLFKYYKSISEEEMKLWLSEEDGEY